jgi:hypothetical protein
LGKINKTLEESKTIIEKWAYFFRNTPMTSPEDLEKNYSKLSPSAKCLSGIGGV